jgi:hypothetical protein
MAAAEDRAGGKLRPGFCIEMHKRASQTRATRDMPVASAATFGPVAAVFRFDDEQREPRSVRRVAEAPEFGVMSRSGGRGHTIPGEAGNGFDRRLHGLAVRGVSHARQNEPPTRAGAIHTVDLRERAVLILGALDGEDRSANSRGAIADIEFVLEARIEPRVVPAAKGVVDVRMPARELFAQIGRFVSDFSLCDLGEREVLDEKCGAISTTPRTRRSSILPA